MRQAMAHLQDETALIKSRGVFDGAADYAYGPVPASPESPYAPENAVHNPYPFSISAAKKLLTSHGWKVVPEGTTTCARPGKAANECGAGIPAHTPLSWNLIYATGSPTAGAIVDALASNAKKVGINISLSGQTFNYIISNLSDVSNPSNDNIWAMQDFGGFTDALYPTTNELFNTTGSFDIGGYSDPRTDKKIHDSEFSLNDLAVKSEASYITAQQPGLFEPNEDRIYAFRSNLHGPSASFAATSQFEPDVEYWYYTK
jgi:peptide/nickel transport system substrate-binding protein